MKSKIIEKILFVLLFSALACFVACSGSDEKEDLNTNTDADTSDSGMTDDDAADADSNDTTSDNSDSTDDSADTTPDNPDTTPENPDSTPDDTDTTDNTDTTDDADTSDETDTDFEKESEGCTMIEVPKITMSGYPDEINGYFSPAMGGNAIDIIKIFLMGDLKEGTYELGTGVNDNYAQCQQCVMVWVDAELAAAQEYYFQTTGTLEITKVAGEGDAQRTNGNIKNLIMKQAEDNLDYIFISNGKCIAAKFVEWETITDDPSTPGND